jgi:hypothetical protein
MNARHLRSQKSEGRRKQARSMWWIRLEQLAMSDTAARPTSGVRQLLSVQGGMLVLRSKVLRM